MNANQLINMVIRMVMRRVIGRGINAGIDMAANKMSRGKPEGERRDEDPRGREAANRAKQAMKVTRRMGRF